MPVRSLKQSVWRWPAPEQVLEDVQVWAQQQQQRRVPSLQRLGVFGSYGRGTAAFGSDLDLILVGMPRPKAVRSSACSSGRSPTFPSVVTPWCSPPLNWSNA